MSPECPYIEGVPVTTSFELPDSRQPAVAIEGRRGCPFKHADQQLLTKVGKGGTEQGSDKPNS
ncbi:hypothetical protein KIN20_013994 [Parelaphostrongylus tenuis]|uniref:Uncharacterized protein n=1 Tax=Parelaphostrongylus tenuis TaxID=148309 RepID=A0AAD5MEC0_PARTN|nr:hypothetical protein KIN20_013994 [Parelaphostrongylus tenuis]